MEKLSGIKLRIDESESVLYDLAKARLKKEPRYFRIIKKSLDARKKNDIHYIYTIEFGEEEIIEKPLEKINKNKLPAKPIVVVGSGPSGLFCALRLIERGFTPIVIERGESIDERVKTCRDFEKTGRLNPQSNIQFGEGGAGTFSDGKLNTQTHGEYTSSVAKIFVRFGAPEEIQWLSKPHIGSDNLRTVIKNLRQFIEKQGGKVLFNTALVDIKIEGGEVKEITLSDGQRIEVSALVLAIGHSARDTVETLYRRGVNMRAKDFAVGVRIEHLQKNIGLSQYGEAYRELPPADYKLVYKGKERSAFTFCMCPGGFVTASSSEEGGVVTNGMSNYARDGENANSALIVQVRTSDYGGGVLDGIEFQRNIERRALNKGYKAPVQRVEDFLKNKTSNGFGEVKPTYPRGTEFVKMDEVLPRFITDTLRLAITDMDKRLKGFAHPDALLTAPETRTSSPVRIERDEKMTALFIRNLYPCGEGAGYAGGITSSASDGLKVAETLYRKFNGEI